MYKDFAKKLLDTNNTGLAELLCVTKGHIGNVNELSPAQEKLVFLTTELIRVKNENNELHEIINRATRALDN